MAKEVIIKSLKNHLRHLEENKKRIFEISSNSENIIQNQIELIIATTVIAEENDILVTLLNKLTNNLYAKFPHQKTTEKIIEAIQKRCSIIIKKIDNKILMFKDLANKRGINLN